MSSSFWMRQCVAKMCVREHKGIKSVFAQKLRKVMRRKTSASVHKSRASIIFNNIGLAFLSSLSSSLWTFTLSCTFLSDLLCPETPFLSFPWRLFLWRTARSTAVFPWCCEECVRLSTVKLFSSVSAEPQQQLSDSSLDAPESHTSCYSFLCCTAL